MGVLLHALVVLAAAGDPGAARTFAQQAGSTTSEVDCFLAWRHLIERREAAMNDARSQSISSRNGGVIDMRRARAAMVDAGYPDATLQGAGRVLNIAMRLRPQQVKEVNDVSVSVSAAIRRADPRMELHGVEVVQPMIDSYPACRRDLEILFIFIQGDQDR